MLHLALGKKFLTLDCRAGNVIAHIVEATEQPDLESCYQSQVEAALEFACGIDNFNDLVDPRCLYNHCLGPKASRYMLRKILREEKTIDTKKRKLNKEKGETTTSPIICTVPFSPTPSLEMVTFSPPTTHSKGKSKIGKTDKELKELSSIPSHKLVVVANNKVESMEAESSRLRKDLIEAMSEATKAKGKVKELNEALKMEKLLIAQKDEEIRVALLQTDKYYRGFELLRKWMVKHHSHAMDFSNLDFEAIDTNVLPDEAKEQEEATVAAVEGNGATEGRLADEGHVNDVVTAP
nr:hypothetical protein CFP56_58945 [Quercus suber]